MAVWGNEIINEKKKEKNKCKHIDKHLLGDSLKEEIDNKRNKTDKIEYSDVVNVNISLSDLGVDINNLLQIMQNKINSNSKLNYNNITNKNIIYNDLAETLKSLINSKLDSDSQLNFNNIVGINITKEKLSLSLQNELDNKLDGNSTLPYSQITDISITKDDLNSSLKNEIDNKLTNESIISWENISGKPQLADGSWKPPVENFSDLPLNNNQDGDLRIVLSQNIVYTWTDKDTGVFHWEEIGANDTNVEWTHIQNKPSTFTPSNHSHNDLYYTESEIQSLYYNKTYLNEYLHQHSNKNILDTIDSSKINNWDKVTLKANAIDLGNHIGNATMHTTFSDKTKWNQVVNKVDKISGKSLSTEDFTTNLKDKLEALSESASIDYTNMHNDLESHITNSSVHVTSIEKQKWDDVLNKVNQEVFENHSNNSNIHVTSTEKNLINQITSKASNVTLNNHINNEDVHVTSIEKTKWNNMIPLSGTTELEGDIIPNNGGCNLGNGSRRFSRIYGSFGFFSFLYNLSYFYCSPTFPDNYYLSFGSGKDLRFYHKSSNDISYISTQQNHDTIFSANPTGSAEIPMLTMKSDGSKLVADVEIENVVTVGANQPKCGLWLKVV